jgi:hypothetical protein
MPVYQSSNVLAPKSVINDIVSILETIPVVRNIHGEKKAPFKLEVSI